jgi:hypothetical protein
MSPTPYQPPLALQTIQYVALASKSYRVFGLADEAWLNAREDLKKRLGNKSNDNHEEEQEDMMELCEAISTALQEDAGGFGTAGFHLVRLVVCCVLFCVSYTNILKTKLLNSLPLVPFQCRKE